MNPRTVLSGPSSRLFSTSSSSSIFAKSIRPKSLPNLRLHQQSRTILTFPHPTLESSSGSTKLIIKTLGKTSNIPSLLHLYTILKKLEKKLKIEIFDFTLPKDSDSLLPLGTIFLTTFKPVQLDDGPVLMEIKIPKEITKKNHSNFLGGPTLEDIQNILNNESDLDIKSSKSTKDGLEEEIIQIKIEIQRDLAKTPTNFQLKRINKFKRQRYNQNGKEASEIIKSLKSFKGGFYGGFDGLAEKFDHLIIDKSESKVNHSSLNTLKSQSSIQSNLQSSSTSTSQISSESSSSELESESEQSEEAAVPISEITSEFEPVKPGETLSETKESLPSLEELSKSESSIDKISSTSSQNSTSPSLSKAQIEKQTLRESAILSAQRELEIRNKKQEEDREASLLAEKLAKEKEAEDRQRIEQQENENEKKDGSKGGFLSGVFGKKD